jgi:uncharacterized repeat protein (TIGR03943 family)
VNPVDASLAVLSTGLLALYMGLTNAMLKYVKPSMRPWLLFAGVLLVAAGIYGLVRARQDGRVADDHHRRGPVGWFLVVPLLVLFILGQQALGAFAASRETRGLPPYSFDIEAYADQFDGTPDLRLVDVYLGASQRGNREYLAAHVVRLQGFVTPDASLGPRGFVLTRFLVSCCAADATPIRLGMIDGDRAPKANAWVEVTAQLVPSVHRLRGANDDPIAPSFTMKVHSIERIDEPSQPYESLR